MTEEKTTLPLGGVQRGVERGGLGMTYGPTPTTPGKAADLLAEVRETAAAVQEAITQMQVATMRVQALEVEVVEHAQAASDLWHALYDVMRLVRSSKGLEAEEMTGEEVAAALAAVGDVLLRHEAQYRRPEPVVCPECAAGKHPNCTKVVPVGDTDEMTPCGCSDDEHVTEEQSA